MALNGFGCLQIVLGGFGGFQRFAALEATVKFVALNLKEVDNSGKFLQYLPTMTLKFP